MTNINLLYVSAPGCHFQVKGTQAGNSNLGTHHLQWNDYNVEILKHIKLT